MVLPCPPSNNLRHVFNVFISKRGTVPCRCQGDEAKKHLVAVPSVTLQKRLPQLKARLGLVSESGPTLHSILALQNLEFYTLDQEEEISYPNPFGFEESPGAPGQEGV